MDLTQRKLTKSEWEGIEVPVDMEERRILNLIKDGYNDINIRYNHNKSLASYMKIDVTDDITAYLYNRYFKTTVDQLNKKYGMEEQTQGKKKSKKTKTPKLKTADVIRIENIDSNTNLPFIDNERKYKIFEYVILEVIELLFKNKSKDKSKWVYYYYTLRNLNRLSIDKYSAGVKKFADGIIETCDNEVDMHMIITRSQEMIEKNEYLLRYADISLYQHQKQLFNIFKSTSGADTASTRVPKMVLYIAPTATGKTLSPIGLAEQYKVIFVCAARHVGLALAKSAISAGRKIALAFNCNDAEDVRLHYSAVKEATRDWRSGAIRKVDNTVGDLVEIMICDIKSYTSAMFYMLAFNKKEDCIVYWDEPTITMDYNDHSFHPIIKNNWTANLIPNIVLSSATLPKEEEIMSVIGDYRGRFGGEVRSVISHDCKKSIPIINRNGEIYLPHMDFGTHEEALESVRHCESYPTILRYMDLEQVVQFILYVNKKSYIKPRYSINNYFESIDNINMASLKEYYLVAIKHSTNWNKIYHHFQNRKVVPYQSNIHMVTNDAYTLTDGPTIYLAEDIDKVARFCLQEARIPDKVMEDIMEDIEFNNLLNAEIDKLERDYEDGIAKDADKENKIANLRISPELKRLKGRIDGLRNTIKSTKLNDLFIPNRRDHLNRYKPDGVEAINPFTCDISESIVTELMQLSDIEPSWKVLLLMGIGVFTNHESIAYTEIMKKLAEQQKLYMIIASSDYIYGTNYQFCQSYIGKDLSGITQEKTIQAMGRVGRNKMQQSYSIRFRDDNLIRKLFLREENKPEVANMNRLFCT